MKKLIMSSAIAVLFFSITFFVPSMAQAPECAPANLLTKLAALKSTGDNAKDVETLLEVRDRITAQHVACNGYTFEGNAKQVIRPFDLPEGIYVLSFSGGSGGVGIKAKTISGDCLNRFNLFTMNAQGKVDAEEIVESRGCTVALEVDFTALGGAATWTLTIEPLS